MKTLLFSFMLLCSVTTFADQSPIDFNKPPCQAGGAFVVQAEALKTFNNLVVDCATKECWARADKIHTANDDLAKALVDYCDTMESLKN